MDPLTFEPRTELVAVTPKDGEPADGSDLTAEAACDAVHTALQLPRARLRLVWEGRMLDAHEKLLALGLESGGTIHCMMAREELHSQIAEQHAPAEAPSAAPALAAEEEEPTPAAAPAPAAIDLMD